MCLCTLKLFDCMQASRRLRTLKLSPLQTSYTSVPLAYLRKRTSFLAYMFNTVHVRPKRKKSQNVLRRVLTRESEDTRIIACTCGTTYERSSGLHRLQNTSVRFCLEHKDSAGKHLPYSNMFVWISQTFVHIDLHRMPSHQGVSAILCQSSGQPQ